MVQKIHSKGSAVLPKSAPLSCSFIKLKGGVVFCPYLKGSLTKCTTRVQTRKGPLLAQTSQLWQRQRSWPNIDIQIHSSRQQQSDEKKHSQTPKSISWLESLHGNPGSRFALSEWVFLHSRQLFILQPCPSALYYGIFLH